MKRLFILLSLASTMTTVAQNVVPTVSVVGEASINVEPTIVNISLSVEREGTDVKLLRQKNGESIAKVIQAINEQEIPLENFKTDYVSLQKQYDYNTKTYKYRISQDIKIKLTDLSKYETLMDKLFEAGVNQIDGISFDITEVERAKITQDARIAALDNARKKALLYAITLEQNIGKALTIKEVGVQDEEPVVFRMKEAAALGSPSKQTLAPGNISIEASIMVTFELLKQ
ncbi:SIMPL domain-containing protein [Capnocytophaga sp. oral taxon 332]|jgi:hypothetical protein|uniref:SIMPL domain-containing protein n=1 Tax=Capnocytophaga sp. oral taxon 332 TaxID=712213 RepID=UPI00054FDA17|nr:SIMPL domain-containing protein [Capnocytophaga sp. oral taxon 332]